MRIIHLHVYMFQKVNIKTFLVISNKQKTNIKNVYKHQTRAPANIMHVCSAL